MENKKRVAIGIFGMVPIEILTDNAASPHVKVFVSVASFCGHNGWSMSYQEIADRAGCSRHRAMESVKALIASGWIGMKRKAHGLRNEYVVLYPVVETVEASELPAEPDIPAGDPQDTIPGGDPQSTKVVTCTSPSGDPQVTTEVTCTSPVLDPTPYKDQIRSPDFELESENLIFDKISKETGMKLDPKFFAKRLVELKLKDPRLGEYGYLIWSYNRCKDMINSPKTHSPAKYYNSILGDQNLHASYFTSLRSNVSEFKDMTPTRGACPVCGGHYSLYENRDGIPHSCGYSIVLEKEIDKARQLYTEGGQPALLAYRDQRAAEDDAAAAIAWAKYNAGKVAV